MRICCETCSDISITSQTHSFLPYQDRRTFYWVSRTSTVIEGQARYMFNVQALYLGNISSAGDNGDLPGGLTAWYIRHPYVFIVNKSMRQDITPRLPGTHYRGHNVGRRTKAPRTYDHI